MGVDAGGCPHTAIRGDTSINHAAAVAFILKASGLSPR